MGWPQVAYIILAAMSVGVVISKHGKPDDGKFNAIFPLIRTTVVASLLYAGGFFA